MKEHDSISTDQPASHSDLARPAPTDESSAKALAGGVSYAPAAIGTTASSTPPPEAPPGPATATVLDHLRRGRLSAGWAAATEGPGNELPGRADLERHFGTSLTQVRVHSGPAARSLLDHLGARAAASGHQILVADRSVDRATLTHEVAHTIQSTDDAPPDAVVEHHDPAEDEAEAIALGMRPARVQRRLRRGAVALRRVRQRHPDPASGPVALGSEALDQIVPRASSAQRQVEAEAALLDQPEAAATDNAPDDNAPDVEAVVAPATETDEQADDEATGDQGEQMEEQAAGDMDGGREQEQQGQANELPESPNRRDELNDIIDETQGEWDDGATEADEHEVAPCPEHATEPGTQPFARGPPLEVPEISNDTAPEPTQPVEVSTRALDAARGGVAIKLGRAPARAPPVDHADLDEDERNAKRQAQAEINRVLGEQGPGEPAVDPLDLTGDADPERITTKQAEITATVTQRLDAAQTGTEEDFGETAMAPEHDPTTDLDTGLDGLDVPEVEMESLVAVDQLDRVATDANAGTLSIDSVVLVTDEAAAASQLRYEAIGSARQGIDDDIAASEAEAERHCTRARSTRAEVERRVREGMATRRERWSGEIDDHVALRRREADNLVRTRRAHVEEIQTTTDREAAAVVDQAKTESGTLWEDTRQRAENKANESDDSSWFSRGIGWLRDALRDLVSWIDGFIEDCRDAIDAMLDAASAIAHAIIDAGHAAITATIDGLHAGLDLIADNLPGELGELAREHRDDIHEWLDDRQADVDQWADDLHQGVDETIEDLRQDLHDGFDAFQETVHDVADTIDEALDFIQNGLMPWLRREYPAVAALIDDGLLAPIEWASDLLGDWVNTVLEATGITALQAEMEALHVEALCEPRTEQEQAEDCAAFEAKLQSALETVDDILASPIAQRLQAYLQESRDEAAAEQVEAASGFFDFIRSIAQPIYEWWQAIESTVQVVLDALGSIARAAWRHIASALGIDPNLSPLDAIRQGLEALWETVSEAVAPIIDAIRSAWDWLRNSSFLAPVFDFFASLPELASALGDLIAQIASGSAAWIAEAAQTLADTILPVVESVAGAIADLVLAAIDRVEGWLDGLVAALDRLIAFEAADALVEMLAGVLQAIAEPVRSAILVFKSCALRAWRWLANSLRHVVTFVRKLLDIAVGLGLAFLTFPIGLVAFFAGNVWLHIVPECYKAPIINFILDMSIRFVRFLPEPADFMWGMIYQAILNFLEGIRAAPDEQKVGAVNLFASIFAGNAEVAAGFVVGLAEGVWESTGGTIIFLLQAVAWIMSLPFKLAQWAIGMLSGALSPDDAPEGSDAALDAGEEASPGLRRVRGGGLPRDGPTDELDATQVAERDDEPYPGPDDLGPEHDDLDTSSDGSADEATLDRELDAEPDPDIEPDIEPSMGIEQEGGPGDQGPGRTAEREEDLDGARPAGAPAPLSVAAAPMVGEMAPPAAPEGLSSLSGALQRWISEGFSRSDVEEMIEGARASLRAMIGPLARQAAGGMLQAMNASGAGFAIGRSMGTIVGMIVVEVLLAVFTGGASAAVSAAKAAITGARVTARFASVIGRVRRAIEPLLGIVSRLRGALGDVLRGVRRWFDDVLGWMRGITRRVRPRRPVRTPGPRPPRARPHRPAGRRGGRGGRGGRRGGDRARRRRRRQEQRLRRVMRALRPKVRRMLADGVGGARLRVRLRFWRIRYRLSSLRLVGDGQIVARLNPGARIRLRKIRHAELGRILRPVLAAAQRRYLDEIRAQHRRGRLDQRAERGATPLQAAERRDLAERRRAVRDVRRRRPPAERERGPLTADESRQVADDLRRSRRRNIETPGQQMGRGERQAYLSQDRPLAQLAETEQALAEGLPPEAARVARPSPIRGSRRFADGPSMRQDIYNSGSQDLAMSTIVMGRLRVEGRTISAMNDEGLGQLLPALSREFGVSEREITRMIAAPRSRGMGAADLGSRSQQALVNAGSEHLPATRRRRFRSTIARMLRRVSLRDDLEVGRNPGIGAANAVARQLGIRGQLGLADQFAAGSGYSPASYADVASTDPAARAAALRQAEADIGRIFHRLERSLRRPELYKSTGGFDAQALVAAVRRFLAARRRGVTARRDRREMIRATEQLVTEVVSLLRLYD